jgi:hypothetical protein
MQVISLLLKNWISGLSLSLLKGLFLVVTEELKMIIQIGDSFRVYRQKIVPNFHPIMPAGGTFASFVVAISSVLGIASSTIRIVWR